MKRPSSPAVDLSDYESVGKWLVKALLLHFPFTLSGSLLLLLSLLLLIRSFTNPYSLVLGGMALFFLLGLAILGRLQAWRFRQSELKWDSSTPLNSGAVASIQHLLGRGGKTWYFFRLRFRLWGRQRTGNRSSLFLHREVTFCEASDLSFTVRIPLCGLLRVRGRFAVGDVFGLTLARWNLLPPRSLRVFPAPLSSGENLDIEPALGQEEKSRKKSSEDEKYYMREYIPGDRFRDINWKASSRLDQLITRISPASQEKTSLVSVDFRHYWQPQRESPQSLAHLNYLKRWLLSFLLENKREHPEFQFLIRSGTGMSKLESEEDLERFRRELCTLFFQSDPYRAATYGGAGSTGLDPSSRGHFAEKELYIFTTPFDTTLATDPQTHNYIFSTDAGGKGSEAFHLLNPSSTMNLPGPWFFRRVKLEARNTDSYGQNELIRVPLEVKRL